MKLTDRKPTRVGKYWWKEDDEEAPIIMEVFRHEGRLLASILGGNYRVSTLHGKWSPRIEEPQ